LRVNWLFMTALRPLFVCVLLAAAAPASAQFKWVDATGRTNYGDNPPPDARNVQRVSASVGQAGDDALAGLPFELTRAAQRFPVTLYTTRDCAPCAEASEVLRARGVPYAEMTVNSPEDFEAFRKVGGTNQFPSLQVGRAMLMGLETERWNSQLDAAGYPRNQLPAGWRPPAPRALYVPPPPPPPPAAPYVPLGLGPSG
jgi:glutaredoxin